MLADDQQSFMCLWEVSGRVCYFFVANSLAIAQNDSMPLSDMNSTRYLIKLLELVFDALFMQARACLLVLRALNTAKQKQFKASTELEGLTCKYIWSCVQHEVYCILLTHLGNISPAELNEAALASTKTGLLKLQSSRNTTNNDMIMMSPGTDSQNLPIDPTKVDLNTLMGRKRMGAFNFASITSTSTSGNPTSSNSGNTTANTNPKDPQSNITGGSGGNTSSSGTAIGGGGQGGGSSIGGGAANANQIQNSVTLFSFSNASHYLGISNYVSENRAMVS
ncbi:unnamed protein product [Trichobilharzia regenti]|nr:unnamed protein product [Trichobilharzia regenti]